MAKQNNNVGWIDYTQKYGDRKIKTINPGIQSGSTVLFKDFEDMQLALEGSYPGVDYGTHGLSTQKAFEEALCKLENGFRSYAFPSGINAITNTLMAFTQSGDEILLCDNAYGPTKRFCHNILTKYNVKTTHIESNIGSEISNYINDNTRLIFLESPGSNTFEIQDILEIVKAAKKTGVMVIIDSTWATPLYIKPLDLGVDIAIQSVTKYICGHSDVLMGCATVNEKYADEFAEYFQTVENYTNPQDCYIALRGLRTLKVRLEEHEKSAYKIAQWLEKQEIVDCVIHPGLESHPQHSLWKRDFSGSSGLFSFTFKEPYSTDNIAKFINSLKMFALGFSWGGYKSLLTARPYERDGKWLHDGKHVIRLSIGLEETKDLIEDLKQGFNNL
ncbi:MAG: cystathionine beta-lyase [Pseudomonadota bacterium]|nr:cystathionine beta-lyase [Pseudomonadota bacterium]